MEIVYILIEGIEMILNVKSYRRENRLPETKDVVWGTIRSFPSAAIYVIFWGKCAKGQNDRQSNIQMPLERIYD